MVLEIDSINGFTIAGGGVTSGLIFMWHGTLANIPSGYVLCDGNNGTPNLLDRFLQEVPNTSTDPGSTGGSTSKTSANHQHTSGNHSHSYFTQNSGASSSYTNTLTGGYWLPTSTHGHQGTVNSTTPGNMTNGQETWTDGRPKYYAVAYIMKT